MSELKPCPLCGATPHRQLSKVWHDQLHGEPHQDTILKCPHDHVAVRRSCYELAVAEWNTRALGPALDVVIEAVEAMPKERVYAAIDKLDFETGAGYKAVALALLYAIREQSANSEGGDHGPT